MLSHFQFSAIPRCINNRPVRCEYGDTRNRCEISVIGEDVNAIVE